MTYKQVIVIRKDLKMGSGKMVSQGSHASLGSFLNAGTKTRKAWLEEGAKKIVVKINTLEGLQKIYKEVKTAKLPHFFVIDAGLTQIEGGTATCLGIGPAEERKIDKVTKGLKLL